MKLLQNKKTAGQGTKPKDSVPAAYNAKESIEYFDFIVSMNVTVQSTTFGNKY